MKIHWSRCVATACLAAMSLPAGAAIQLGDHLTFSGFGTLGAVSTNTDKLDFTRDHQLSGATSDFTRDNFTVDSNLGLQLTGRATDWLSATVQTLSIEHEKDRITTGVEWAFVKVTPVKGLSIRGGRMALPLFAISDFRNVNYANIWVRPPNEVYAMAMLTRLDGADASYTMSLGSTNLTASLLSGESVFYGPAGDTVKVKNVRGFNVLWDWDWGTFRVGQVKAKVTITNPWDPYTFTGVGVTIDRNNIVAQAEYATRRSGVNPGTVNANGWYVLGGYRFGKLLPYASYAYTNPPDESFVHLTGKQTTAAVGLRWDAFSSAAIKFQVEHVDTHGTTGTSFSSPETSTSNASWLPNTSLTSPVNVVSASVDFVF